MHRWCLAGLALIVAGCGRDNVSRTSAQEQRPVEVGVVQIRAQRVLLTTELPGRTSAFRAGEVRARVDGIVEKRLYREGADVRKGQQLYQIDPAPYKAALQGARAQRKSAEASAQTAKLLAERYSRLVKRHAVSQQDYDNARAQEKTARANVEAALAQVRTAKINLGYTRVYSPITGRSGPSAVPEGAYVQQSQATLLTTVTALDPIYVDTMWSTSDLLRLRGELERGQLTLLEGKPKVTVVLENGHEYAHPGTLLLTGVRVDETTGSVPLRALVPNPDGTLLPGMYVRARIEEGVQPHALLVPQRGVTHDRAGQATALVVGKAGKVELRKLRVDRAIGNAWLVTSGLASGDQVIVEGAQRVQPGATVKAVFVPSELGQPAPPQPQARRAPEVR